MQEFANEVATVGTMERFSQCGSWLHFIADKPIEKRKLMAANFCKWRFCPMCAWRKAVQDTLRIDVLMQYIYQKQHKDFIFLTLTAPNVPADKLRDEIGRQNKAFKKLFERDEIEKMCHGFIRKTEITYNPKRDDYHPHLHIVIAVTKGYFSGGRYIKQARWLQLWREVMQDDLITQVDVRRVKKRKDSAGIAESFEVAELAKYAAKDADYTASQEVFEAFYYALKGRKQLTYGGLFADANAMFKDGELDDYIKPDLTAYYWNLKYSWATSQYNETAKSKFDAVDRLFLERKGMVVDDEIPNHIKVVQHENH